jgi:hypothetical protein
VKSSSCRAGGIIPIKEEIARKVWYGKMALFKMWVDRYGGIKTLSGKLS